MMKKAFALLLLTGVAYAQTPAPIKIYDKDSGPAAVTSVGGVEALNVKVLSTPAGASGLTDAELRASPVPVSGTVASTQSGNWSARLTDFTLNLTLLNSAPGSDTGQVAVPVRLISALPVPATQSGVWSNRLTDGTDTALVSATGKLEVTCDNCGGSSFADNSAFTFGTTSVMNVGFVFDDVAPNAVTENRAATPRMSANRVPYATLRDAAGNERGANVTAANALVVDGSAVTQPVSGPITDAQIRATPLPVSGTITVGTFPDNEPINVAQVNGVATSVGNGVSNTGTQRVTLASDSTGVVGLATGANVIGALTANQSVNQTQVNGVAVATANGVVGTGVQRVAIASDNTAFTVNAAQSGTWNVTNISGTVSLPTGAATETTLGTRLAEATFTTRIPVNGQALMAASIPVTMASNQSTLTTEGPISNNVAPGTSKPEQIAGYSWTDGTAPTVTTAGNVTRLLASTDGRLAVTTDHPKRVNCRLTTTATTSTVVTGCAAPGAGLSIYITDIHVFGGVAVGATAAATIQSGTGGTCGTGTVIHNYCQHTATSGCVSNLSTPIKAVANGEVCILDATVGTKFVSLSGYIAP